MNLMMVGLILTASIFFVACEKDNEAPSVGKGQIALSFDLKDITTDQNLKSTGLKSQTSVEPAAIVTTITDASGTKVYDNEKMELFKFGDDYVTQALTLDPGTYTVTEYYVVDGSNNVIYITPKDGAPKASWVDNPLPIDFSIVKDEVTKLAPEVISTENSTPEDFGYATFRLNLVDSFDFLIAVFAYSDTVKSYDLVSAQVTVSSNETVLTTKSIPAITDTLSVPGNVDPFIIQVEKEGYKTYSDTISNADLQKYFASSDNGPLKIYLQGEDDSENAITLVTDQSTLKQVKMDIRTFPDSASNLYIDWGDGTPLEKSYYRITHDYKSTGLYTIKVIGDVNNIKIIDIRECNLRTIDLSLAKNLISLFLEKNQISNINISGCIKLQGLYIHENNLTNIDLKNNSSLEYLWISRNSISHIDLSHNSEIVELHVNSNKLKELNISGLTNLEELWCGNNRDLSKLVLTNHKNIKTLHCAHTKLANINITQCPNLKTLDLAAVLSLETLDVSKNLKLERLSVRSPFFGFSLDISNNTELTSLSFQSTNILDISNNKKLKRIGLHNCFFGEEQMNSFYIQLHKNISENNVSEGYLSLNGIEPTDPYAIEAKQDIIETYGWTIKHE